MQRPNLQHDLESVLLLIRSYKARIDQHNLAINKRDRQIPFVRFDLLLQPSRHILFKRLPQVLIVDLIADGITTRSYQLIEEINDTMCDAMISAGKVKNSGSLFNVMGSWNAFIKPFLNSSAPGETTNASIAETYAQFTSLLPLLAKAEVTVNGKRYILPNNKGKKYRTTAVSVPVAATITGISAKTIRRSRTGAAEYRPAPLEMDIDAVMAWGRYYWGIKGDKKMANAMNHPLNVNQLSENVRRKYGL